jgi:hypothetical protein
MPSVAVAILSVTVVLGIALAMVHLRGTSRPPWMIGALHGVLGAVGLGTLVLALRGPPRGVQASVASFGGVAAVLAAAALAVGLGVVTLARRSRRGVGLAIAVHFTLAVTAYVLLAAYVSLG